MFRCAKEVNSCLLEIQKGNKNPFVKDLYDLTAMHLTYVARMYLTNKNLADDVVSVMFIKMMSYIDSFDTTQDGYNWLCKIAQNTARTFNQKEKKVTLAENAFALTLDKEYVERGFDKVEFILLIEKLDGKLDDIDKEIACLRFLEGETMENIGKQLSLSKVAVYQRVRKICKYAEKNLKNK